MSMRFWSDPQKLEVTLNLPNAESSHDDKRKIQSGI